MGHRYSKEFITAAILAATAFSSEASFAGGFALNEQSAYYQGMSMAGAAAGDDLSSMYWNPAAAAARPGINTESVGTGILPNSKIKATGGSLYNGTNGDSGNIGSSAFVPSSYYNYQVNDRLYFGLAMNSPYGLSTKPENTNWAGAPLGLSSTLFTLDINPTLAYKVTPNLTIGFGPQIEYVNVHLTAGPSAPFFTGTDMGGHDWTAGATAGVLWQPTHETSFGFGYRSSMVVDTDLGCHGSSYGTLQAQGGLANAPASLAACDAAGSTAHTKFTLPETFTFSVRQYLNDRFALSGTVQYTDHSSVQTIQVINAKTGNLVNVLPLDFNNGWLFSLGGEYKYNQNLTLRTGFAYEHSPVSDSNRLVILPDTDRFWASAGASYNWNKKISFDLGYTHLFFDDNATIQTGTLLTAKANTSVDIVSIGMKYHLGGTEFLEPLK